MQNVKLLVTPFQSYLRPDTFHLTGFICSRPLATGEKLFCSAFFALVSALAQDRFEATSSRWKKPRLIRREKEQRLTPAQAPD